jgi:hypothetical protein
MNDILSDKEKEAIRKVEEKQEQVEVNNVYKSLLSVDQSSRILSEYYKSISFSIFLGLAFVFLYVMQSNSITEKSNLVAFPVDADYAYPFVYSINEYSLLDETRKLYQFVADYTHLKYDESRTVYSRVIKDKRYKNMLSDNLKKAWHLSAGKEQSAINNLMNKSYETAKILKKSNSGWEFLTDCIEIVSSKHSAVYEVDVFGSFQLTRDSATNNLPHRNWGYFKLRYTVMHGPKLYDQKGEDPLNGYGLYVVNSKKIPVTKYKTVKRIVHGCNYIRGVQ